MCKFYHISVWKKTTLWTGRISQLNEKKIYCKCVLFSIQFNICWNIKVARKLDLRYFVGLERNFGSLVKYTLFFGNFLLRTLFTSRIDNFTQPIFLCVYITTCLCYFILCIWKLIFVKGSWSSPDWQRYPLNNKE